MEILKHLLRPGVELQVTPELEAQLRPTNIDHRLPCRTHHGVVERFRTIPRENIEHSGNAEDEVQIRNRKKLLLTRLEPLRPGLATTQRTTAVATRTEQPV